jgi:hypothetical protein
MLEGNIFLRLGPGGCSVREKPGEGCGKGEKQSEGQTVLSTARFDRLFSHGGGFGFSDAVRIEAGLGH